MSMGKGGGFDSSGPQGLGADAFGGGGQSTGYMEAALKAKVSKAYKSYQENTKALYEAFDPQGQYDHNPHLDSLEAGVHDLGRVRHEQLYDWGLISQQQYDFNNMWGNQTMPTGKSVPIEEHGFNMPAIKDYDQLKGFQKTNAMNVSPKGKNIGYKGKPQPQEFDEMTSTYIEYLQVGSAMEDSTERTIKNIERLRRDTLHQAELGPKGGKL